MLPDCPVEVTLIVLGDKWKVLIMRNLIHEKKVRFNALKRSLVGISQKVLTQKLRDLEKLSIIERKVFAEIPPHVEYSLTELGNSLITVINAMAQWGEDHRKDLIHTLGKN